MRPTAAQEEKAAIAATQRIYTAPGKPREQDDEPEQAAEESDFKGVHPLRCNANQYVHHNRADPADQDPQCSAGYWCERQRDWR
jgi:hypothetical protein